MAKSRDIDEAIKRVGQSDRDKLYIKKGDKFKKREKELIQEYKTLQEEKRKTGPVPLTKQQERFVDFYVSKYGEKSATQCAIDAGYNEAGAHVRASELLNPQINPNVVLEIQSRLAAMREVWDIDRDKHMAMLTRIRDEARIKGQYGVVAKCEELKGKVAGLYIEKSMVLQKNVDESENPMQDIKSMYKSRDDFDKAMIIMGNEMWPDETSEMYEDVEIDKTKEEKEKEKALKEMEEYQEMRKRECDKQFRKK